MDAFYFGPSNRPLFGMLHRPEGSVAGRPGMVLCPPAGVEFDNTYRTLYQLGGMLAARGMAVLRFHYGGTGDSGGDHSEADIGEWLADVGLAVRELENRGFACAGLAGLRFGATLASLYAEASGPVDALALWEPVTDGQGFLDLLRNWHLEMTSMHQARDEAPPVEEPVMGWPPLWREQVAAIRLEREKAARAASRVLWIEPERHEQEIPFWRAHPHRVVPPLPVLSSIVSWSLEPWR